MTTTYEQSASRLLDPQQAAIGMRANWLRIARTPQLTPSGDWQVWLLLGGRGAGKTRTGAEDMAWYALNNPGVRCAVIAPTSADARDTCIEGDSGLLRVIPPECVQSWNRSLGELILFNGSRFKLFSAEEPDRLCGPQHHRAWCDEVAAWRYEETWDQMLFGLRLGNDPRVVVTTTPRPVTLIRRLLNDPRAIKTSESTYANAANLAPSALKAFRDRYEGTRLGRQELMAEVLDDVPGALWRRSDIDGRRIKENEVPDLVRVVVGVDPATAAPDGDEGLAETGIVVAGLGVDGRGYILNDLSCRLSPDGWARRAVSGIDQFDGDAIVAETNQGGQMVISTIKSVRPTIKVIAVHASRGKITRAEPISALYEQGRVSHVGSFPQLEDQMVSFTSAGILGGGTGDRVDALVWALTQLFPKITRKREATDVRVENTKGFSPHTYVHKEYSR